MRWFVILVLTVTSVWGLAAQETDTPFLLEVPLSIRLGNSGLSHVLKTVAKLEVGDFGAVLGLAQYSDDRYDPVASWGFLSWTWYRFLDSGVYGTVGPLSFRAGRFGLDPMIESPYALFRNPVAPAAPTADVVLSAGAFTYRTQWVQLNYNSEFGYRDRGAVIKSYRLDLGDLAFGFQDAAVFDDEFFDFEYFASPLPSYVIQYVNTPNNLPTAQDGDDNSIMGAFLEWSRERLWIYGEFLIDDINLNRFFFPDDRQIPDKLAFGTGARYETGFGTVGLFAALATKHTFQPVGYTNREAQYSYSFVPDVRIGEDGRKIPLEDNYLGYKWGENALSFEAQYDGTLLTANPWWFDLSGTLEWVVNGAKSTGNPWHDEVSVPKESEFLSDSVLEHRLTMRLEASRPLFDWLSVGVQAEVGYVWNGLEVEEVDPALVTPDGINAGAYLVPVAGNNGFVGGLGVTVTGRIKL